MKFKIQYIAAVCCFLFAACQEDPALFSEADGVYFNTDTLLTYSFAKYPRKTTDTIQIPVNVLGNSSGNDRPIGFEVMQLTANNAIEGIHFKILTDAKVPGNKFAGTIPVVIYRTEDLDTGNVARFSIRLKQNADFPAQGIASGQKLTVSLSYIQQPLTWGEFLGNKTGQFAGYKDNFGTWTKTKYKLILDALYDPKTGTTITEFPGSRFLPPVLYNQYVAVVRNYIKTNYPGNYGGSGATLLDPDNNNMPVQVGPANY